jgi:RNA polymerase sigma factor (sigma-70 family)
VDFSTKFDIEVDDMDLLWELTRFLMRTCDNAQREYGRSLAYRQSETPVEPDSLADLLNCKAPPHPSGDGFEFADERLAEPFSKLKPLSKRILRLIFVEGLSPAEAAARLGRTAENVRLEKFRAIKKLRSQLGNGGDEGGK